MGDSRRDALVSSPRRPQSSVRDRDQERRWRPSRHQRISRGTIGSTLELNSMSTQVDPVTLVQRKALASAKAERQLSPDSWM